MALKRPTYPTPYAFKDDHSIANEHQVWRRVTPLQLVPDGTRGGCLRLSSGFFVNSSPGRSEPPKVDSAGCSPMSASLGTEDGNTWDEALRSHPECGLIALTAATLRNCQQGIERDPLPEDKHHVLVFGSKGSSVRNKMLREKVWLVQVPSKSDRMCDDS